MIYVNHLPQRDAAVKCLAAVAQTERRSDLGVDPDRLAGAQPRPPGVSSYRVHVRVGDEWHELDAGPIRADELKAEVRIDPARRLRLDEPGDPRLLDDDETLELYAGMAFSSVEWLRYARSLKHKREPSHGTKGSICPDDLDTARAQELLDASIPGPGRKRWATDGERFFAAHPDNAGGWHGWPEPVDRVPVAILRRWRADGTLT